MPLRVAVACGDEESGIPDASLTLTTGHGITLLDQWPLALDPSTENATQGERRPLPVRGNVSATSVRGTVLITRDVIQIAERLDLPPTYEQGDAEWAFEAASPWTSEVGTATLTRRSSTSPALISDGRVGAAIRFDGTGAVKLPTGLSTAQSGWTLCMWLKMAQHNPSGRTYLADFRGSGGTGYWIFDSNGYMRVKAASENAVSFNPMSGSSPPAWRHYCLVSSTSLS